MFRVFTFCLVLFFSSVSAFAEDEVEDQALADTLKIEANHNLNRIKSYKSEVESTRIFQDEREKALAEFLEEQERWDLIRERGLREYRLYKKNLTPVYGDEDYLADQKQKKILQDNYEVSRRKHVQTRDRIRKQNELAILQLEIEELGIYTLRPRYLTKNRRASKIGRGSSKSSGGSGGYSTGYNPPVQNDIPPPPEFPPAPAPYDNFDDFPPPPPVYDGGVPFDQNFGGDMAIPPPPPPPPDFDF